MFTSTRTRRLAPTALAATFLLLTTACGAGSNDETAVAEEATTTTVASVTDQATESADTASSDGASSDSASGEDGSADDPAAEADDDAAGGEDNTSDDADSEVDDAGSGESSSDDAGSLNNCSLGQLDDSHALYVVGNIPDDDPDGGLVVRLLPGSDGPRSTVLPPGTEVIVDGDLNGDICTVIGSSVWWHLGPSPELAVGGWVNSAYLYDILLETDEGIGDEDELTGPVGEGEDDFDVVSAQIECIYNDNPVACDLLATFVAGPDENYGLGNSYSMAPSEFLVEDCLVASDQIACAELRTREAGTDVPTLAAAFVQAFQDADAATQTALSGDRPIELNSTPVTNTDPTVTIGVDSIFVDGNEFSWTFLPTLTGRCFVTDGVVQGCVVSGG